MLIFESKTTKGQAYTLSLGLKDLNPPFILITLLFYDLVKSRLWQNSYFEHIHYVHCKLWEKTYIFQNLVK